MREGWLKWGALVVAAILLVGGYLVLRSGGEEEHRPESKVDGAVIDADAQVAAIRESTLGVGQTVEMKTVRCPTQAVFGGHVQPPAMVSVAAFAGSDPRLVAYASSGGSLLPAPAGWECVAAVGADGNQSIAVGPPGSVSVPKRGGLAEIRGRGPAVRASFIPACEGCVATAICSFFPRSTIARTYESPQPCAAEPDGEKRFRLSRSTFAFVDPPRVSGSSVGSGGWLPSIGALSFAFSTGVRQLGCTIAPREFDRCAAAVAAFLDLGRQG
jgi:hypothetical protein